MENGDVIQYIHAELKHGRLVGDALPIALNRWVSTHTTQVLLYHNINLICLHKLHQTALALRYLHTESIFHGNLRGNNVLIDNDDCVRVADATLSTFKAIMVHASGLIYDPGAIRWLAPELIDPDQFNLDSTRPTARSDIYSLGCLCLEVSIHCQWVIVMFT